MVCVHVCGEGLIEDVREQHACLSVRPQLSSRLESVCNFALQLESEVEAGQKAHTQLEEQYDMLTQVSGIYRHCINNIASVAFLSCLLAIPTHSPGEGRFRASTGSKGGSIGKETRGNGMAPPTGLPES